MSISRLRTEFNPSRAKTDLWESVGMACLSKTHRAFGYSKVSLPTEAQKTTTKKIKASAGWIFLFLLTLPLSASLTLIGVVCLSLSKTHKEKYQKAFRQSAPNDGGTGGGSPPPPTLSPPHQFSRELLTLTQTFVPEMSEEEKIQALADYSNKIQAMDKLKLEVPKQHHLLHYNLCKVSDKMPQESENVKKEWLTILDQLAEITIEYPDSPHHPSFTIREKLDVGMAKERVEGKKPILIFKKSPPVHPRTFQELIKIKRLSYEDGEEHSFSETDIPNMVIVRNTRNNEIVGYIHKKKDKDNKDYCDEGWKPGLGILALSFEHSRMNSRVEGPEEQP